MKFRTHLICYHSGEKYIKKINILSFPVDFSLSLCYNINIKRNKEVPNEVPDGFKKSHALNPHPPRRRFYLRYVPRWRRRLSAYVRWRRRPPLGWLRRLPRVHSSRSLHITRSSGLSRLRVLTAVKKERRCFPRSYTSRIFLLSPPIAPCFFYVYICYLLFLFLRTQLLDTPTVFFFFKEKKIGRWPGCVGRSIGFWGGDEYRVYNIPWCDFGIVCPGIDQSCFNVGLRDDDDKRWLRMPPRDDGLFNGDYQQNPMYFFYEWSFPQRQIKRNTNATTNTHPPAIRITSFIYSSLKQHQP